MTRGRPRIRNIGLLATMAGAGPPPRSRHGRRGARLGRRGGRGQGPDRLRGAGGRAGRGDRPRSGPPPVPRPSTPAGAAVVPGFVDAHTHLAYAGDRDEEIRRRLAGATYRDIAAAGGGIVTTVAATRAATREELAAAVASRLDEMLLQGTTTAEVKSGYGLSTEHEIRSLEAIRAAAEAHPVGVVPTFLGAHEVPPEHRGQRARYVDLVVSEMIPEVARLGLAVFCDVFCEEGVFTVDGEPADPDRGPRPRDEAPPPRRRAGLDGRGRAGRRAPGPLRGPSPVRIRRGHARHGRRGLRGHPPPGRGLLPAPRPLRARAVADRGRGARGRGHRRQPRRRPLAVAAVRHGRGLLRHGPLARGGAGRGHRQRRLLARRPHRRGQPRGGQARRPGDPALAAACWTCCAWARSAIHTVVKDGRVVVRDGRRVAA